MLRQVLLVSFAAVVVSNSPIDSVHRLNAAISAGPLRSVGFLSSGNYDTVASVLPKSSSDGGPLEVVIVDSMDTIENMVANGTLLAGLSTSRPENADALLVEFSSSLITMRASLFAPSDPGSSSDSQHMRDAWDAAVVRMIASGDYQRVSSQYFASDKFDPVAAFTCAVEPEHFPFPASVNATGLLKTVLDSKKLRVGSFGPSNWGWQGNYATLPPVGLWPDFTDAVFAHFAAAYPEVQREIVWNSASAGVLADLLSGDSDLTETYMGVSAYYNDRARTTQFDVGCTTLGTESIFFTASPLAKQIQQAMYESSDDDDSLPTWAIAVIVVGSILLALLVVFAIVMVRSEKQGKPIFTSLSTNDTSTTKAPVCDVVKA